MPAREKFATQVNPETLAAVRALALTQGRQIQTLVDEAFADLLEKYTSGKPRARVIAAHLASIEKYGPLYQKLAE